MFISGTARCVRHQLADSVGPSFDSLISASIKWTIDYGEQIALIVLIQNFFHYLEVGEPGNGIIMDVYKEGRGGIDPGFYGGFKSPYDSQKTF